MSHHYADLKTSDLRLVVLRLLSEDPGYSTNDSILREALSGFGHTVSRDKVKTEVRWLEEQGLVTVEAVTSVLIVRLTSRGADVASGAARVDGVKRPGPR
jgi:Fe2+ or Zn2+ uptake regulation protein